MVGSAHPMQRGGTTSPPARRSLFSCSENTSSPQRLHHVAHRSLRASWITGPNRDSTWQPRVRRWGSTFATSTGFHTSPFRPGQKACEEQPHFSLDAQRGLAEIGRVQQGVIPTRAGSSKTFVLEDDFHSRISLKC